MKVLCIGHASYDISCLMDGYPTENQKFTVTEKIETGGGQAANEACMLAKWGIETYLAATVGNDSYGEKMKKEFDMFGVKNACLETSFDKDSSVSFVIINKANGSRTVVNIADDKTSPHLKKEEFPIEPDLVLVDGYEYHASLSALSKYAEKITMIDAGKATPEVIELSKLCKYVICSKDFAEKVSGIKADVSNPSTLLTMYNRIKERYPKSELVITLEEIGAMYTFNNEIKVMPGIKVDVKDTTAAGDIFHGAFAYCILNNYPIEKTVAYANIAAGLSCATIGGKLSIPNLNNVISYYNSKMGVQNNAVQQPNPGGQVGAQAQMPATPAAPNAAPTQQPAPTAGPAPTNPNPGA